MELEIQIKTVYGNELIYPINDKALLLTKLLKKKTFTVNDLEILQELGYKFKIKAYEVPNSLVYTSKILNGSL
tara:strand:- start:24 stop:242 length:219 start_codon:yes stop_codon:yes gene_type:complete